MEPLRRSVCPPLGWLGRHSLVLYLLHQPVIYGVLLVVFRVLGSRNARSVCFRKGGIVVPCKHCANTLTSGAGLWYPVDG